MDHFTSLGRYVYLSSTLLALRFIQNWPTLNVYFGTPDYIEKSKHRQYSFGFIREKERKRLTIPKKHLRGPQGQK